VINYLLKNARSTYGAVYVHKVLSGRTTTSSGQICDHDTVENKFKAFTIPAEVMFDFAVKYLAAYPTSSKYSWAIEKPNSYLSLFRRRCQNVSPGPEDDILGSIEDQTTHAKRWFKVTTKPQNKNKER
jgi:hypothetical protein